MAMVTRREDAFRKPIPKCITSTTSPPASRAQAAPNPDHKAWAKAIDAELDKLDAKGTIRWLHPSTKPPSKQIPLTLSFNYKRDEQGGIEECKARGSVRGEMMKPHVHFDPQCTSAPMVDRVAARMVIAHVVKNGWTLEHMDIHSAFINEKYKYTKPVYIREPARADGSFKYGKTTGILELNLYGNPSGTYYYLDGLLIYIKTKGFKSNEHQLCLVRLITRHGSALW